MVRRTSLPFFLLLLLVALVACGGRPKGVLRPGKMEDVLYDYHLAYAVSFNDGRSAAERDRRYEEAVFAKHAVTADEFYASLRYYETHPDEFSRIYDHLNERFSGQRSVRQAATPTNDDETRGRDIWAGQRFFVLSANEVNRREFEIKVPHNIKAGDRFEWTFDLQWIYSEGRKNGTALLVLHFPGDSTATFSQPLYGSGRQTLVANVGKTSPESISGFIYQECAWSKKARLLVVSNVALRIIPRPEVSVPEGTPSDTLHTRPHKPLRSDSTRAASDTLPAPQPLPERGYRLSREEGEHRILDSVRKHERGRQPHFR